MKLHLNKDDDILLIRGYRADRITIGDQSYRSSIVISPTRLIDRWRPDSLSDVTSADFEPALTLEPEVVLLGTGGRLEFPELVVTRALLEKAIGVEVMDTWAACRTYNILANEGRKVVACLITPAG